MIAGKLPAIVDYIPDKIYSCIRGGCRVDMKIKIFMLGLLFVGLILSIVCGCRSLSATGKKLIVETSYWSDQGSSKDDPLIITDPRAGMEVHKSGHGRIKIRSVHENDIVLGLSGGFVEPNENGTINLNKMSVYKLAIKSGESVSVISKSMSGGVSLKFSYE